MTKLQKQNKTDLSKNPKMSQSTIDVILSARNDITVNAPMTAPAKPVVIAEPKTAPVKYDVTQITFDEIRKTLTPYASMTFVNERDDYDVKRQCNRTRRAVIVDIVDDRVLCVVARDIYTMTLSQLRQTIQTRPLPKNTVEFDAIKFKNSCLKNIDRNIFVPYAQKSKFFADYVK